MDLSSVLHHGEDLFSPSRKKKDVLHKDPIDSRFEHVWLHEPVTSGVLTKDGVEQIANHKYTPGKYTHLERFLNPAWTKMTECMPMWLAPNMMTTLGGLFQAFGYGLTWYFSEEMGEAVPSWICALNGICLFIYYTLDCMDGKQARRTGSSSPLGQLFDHGIDCICNIANISTMSASIMLGDSYWLVLAQTTLQFSFFMGQWEEYYTGVLTHSQGDWVGVTEVAYGMALFSLVNAFLDREAVWKSTLSGSIIPSFLDSYLPEWIGSLETRQFALILWTILVLSHISTSTTGVIRHIKEPKETLISFSKLISPLLLVAAPFLLPTDVIEEGARYVSLSLGLTFSIITIKIVVFSMAKMAYATFQPDVVPSVLICLWASVDDRLTALGAKTLFQLCCFWNTYRLLKWTSTAIHQLCERLDINCFTIKEKVKQM